MPTLTVASWDGALEGAARRALEEDVLPEFLRSQRWFAGKARKVERVRLLDWGPLPAGAGPAWLALFEVSFADGLRHLYHLPLAVTAGSAGDRLLESLPSHVLARLRGPGGGAVLHDALADDALCLTLLDAIANGREFPLRDGTVRALATGAFAELRALAGAEGRPPGVAGGPATSSNSLVLYGGRLLLKLFRRLEVGVNPDFEVGRFLTERQHFSRIPPVAGALEYHGRAAQPTTLAILQGLVANQGDGWSHALDELGRYFRLASGHDPVQPDDRPVTELADSDPPAGAREVIGPYLQTAATLGRRTAELHLALVGGPDDPGFAPEPLTPADLAELARQTAGEARTALDALRDNLDRLPEAFVAPARLLLEQGPAILERLKVPPALPPGTVKTRVHGDYHLGQVLWVDNDFVILDFEGEPTRTVEERRARQSPLKDVAGMLRSFDYAAHAGLFALTRDRPHDFDSLEPWARLWRQWTSASFLREYLARARGAAFLPAGGGLAALLDIFLLDKALYELAYELNNRPDWVRIPLRGVLALV